MLLVSFAAWLISCVFLFVVGLISLKNLTIKIGSMQKTGVRHSNCVCSSTRKTKHILEGNWYKYFVIKLLEIIFIECLAIFYVLTTDAFTVNLRENTFV